MEPYSAYSLPKEKTSMDHVIDVATLPINPATYAWLYTHDPGRWNSGKGISVPFNPDVKAWKLAGGKIARAFKKRGIIAGFGETMSEAWKLRPRLGNQYRIFGGLDDEYAKHTASMSRYVSRAARYERMAATVQRKLMYSNELLAEAQASYDKIKYAPMGKTNKLSVKLKQSALRAQRLSAVQPELTAATDLKLKYESKLAKYMGRADRYSKLANKASAARTGVLIGKTAIRAGKAVSLVGAAMFAWDVAKMVGEPIGRSIVAGMSEIGKTFNDQFMPELGGKLSMAYLTSGAATERQRALQAMSKASITGRSAFGQEAKYSHS